MSFNMETGLEPATPFRHNALPRLFIILNQPCGNIDGGPCWSPRDDKL